MRASEVAGRAVSRKAARAGRAPGSRRVFRRIARYRSSAGWLLWDLARTLPGHILVLAVTSAAAIAARTATFSLLALFVRGLSAPDQAAERVSLGGVKIPVPDPHLVPVLLVVAAAFMSLMLLVDSVLRVRVAKAYSLHASREVLGLLTSGVARPYAEAVSQRDRQYVRRLIDADVITLVRALRPILSILVPAGEFVVAAVVMTMIAPPLSAGVAGLVLVYLIPYAILNRRVMRASRDRETIEPTAHRQAIRVVEAVNSAQYAGALRTRVARAYLGGDLLRERLHVLEVLLLNRRIIGSLNGFFLVLVLALLVGVIVTGAEDPVAVGAFGLLVSYAFNRLNATTKYLAAFNRFLPQFERYVTFRREAAGGTPAAAAAGAAIGRRALPGPVLDASETAVALVPGTVVLAVQPYPVDWTTVTSWWAELPRSDGHGDAPTPIVPPDMLPPVPLAELLGAGNVASLPPRALELLALEPVRAEWERLRPVAERPWPELEESTSYDLRMVVALAPIVAADAPVVVVPLAAWERLSGETRAALAGSMRDRSVVLTSQSVFVKLPPEVTHVVLMNEERLIGIGDRRWFEGLMAAPTLHPDLASLLDRASGGSEGHLSDDMLDDEGDEDDDDDDF